MKTQVLLSLFCLSLLVGCASQKSAQTTQNPYTQGNVTLTLKKGVTTQSQVLETFGAPNIVTQNDDGSEIWIYQKDNVLTTSDSSDSFATLILIGTSHNKNQTEQSARTMTLRITFDKTKHVSAFRSLSTSF